MPLYSWCKSALCLSTCAISFRLRNGQGSCRAFAAVRISRPNLRSPGFSEQQASEDGGDIYRCPGVRTSHSQSNASVFLFMAAFGTTAHAVESGRTRDRSTGRQKSRLTGNATDVFYVNCGNAGIKSSLSGNARFDGSTLKQQFPASFDC